MIILLFGLLLDRAYGLITHATQRSAPMGIHWAFTGTFMGTAALTCIAGKHLVVDLLRLAVVLLLETQSWDSNC